MAINFKFWEKKAAKLLNQNTVTPKNNTDHVLNLLERASSSSILQSNYNSFDSLGKKLVKGLMPCVNSKQESIRAYDELMNFHVVDTIIYSVSMDVLYRNREEGTPFFTVDSSNEKNEKVLNQVLKTFSIDNIIPEVISKTLLYGEYAVFVDYENSELDDRLMQGEWLSIYERGKFAKMYVKGEKSAKDSFPHYEPKDPKNYVIFRLKPVVKRTEILSDSDSKYYVYRGRPLLPLSAVPVIKNIKLLEMLAPLTDLMNIQSKQTVYMRVPPGTDADKGFRLAAKYEKLVNLDRSSGSSSDDIDGLLDNIGRARVIPLFGDKGAVEYQERPVPREVDSEKVDTYLRRLSALAHIPVTYLGVQDDSGTSLKYLQLLKSIRSSLAAGVRDFLYNYTQSKNIAIDYGDIKVKVPNVPGADQLAQADYADATTQVISAIADSVDQFATILDVEGNKIDKQKVVDYFNERTRSLTGTDIFNSVDKHT